MTFDEYQKLAMRTDVLGDGTATDNVLEPAFIAKILGLPGEAGEVTEKFKKIIRDKGGTLTEEDKKDIAKELGDVLWYVAAISSYMGVKMNQIADTNISKLAGRKVKGTLKGKGDNR